MFKSKETTTDTTHIHEKRYSSQGAVFDEEQSKKARDEALWTEYAKAALTGFVSTKEWGDGIDAEDTACFVKRYASAMLAAHKKRWGHE